MLLDRHHRPILARTFALLVLACCCGAISSFAANRAKPGKTENAAPTSVSRPSLRIEPVHLLGPREIAWGALLVPFAALSATGWAALLRHQVRAKTRALEPILPSQRKAQQFDAARNEVLESIAHNAALPESLERLATAVQQQIPGSLCAIVAPGLREDLQPAVSAAVGSALVCGCKDPLENNGSPIAATLFQIPRNAGLPFQAAHAMVLFSTTASMGGLLLLFVGQDSAAEMERAKSSILPSASRLASLARGQSFMHEQLVHEARHDSLTGLPNRAVAEDRLEQALARAQRNSKGFAVVCIDLDGFKTINHDLGHEVGDGVPRAVALRLRRRIRYSDTLARMGGDEFWAILEDCSGAAAAEMAAQAMITALEEPVSLDGRNLKIATSLGIALYPSDEANASQLKRQADQAMYLVKGHGGHQISFWSAEPMTAPRIPASSTLDQPLRKSAKAK
jgi:diguanylate cyclase (GGDEF)-like protein